MTIKLGTVNKKLFKMNFVKPVTSINQSDCFISAKRSYATGLRRAR